LSRPESNEDFEDMLAALREVGADFLIVGSYAVAAHGLLRATEDIDLFVRSTAENAQLVYEAIVRFGAPIAAHGITAADFAKPDTVYQIGLPPRRIDILTSIDGVSFDEACEGAIEGNVGAVAVRFIGRSALVRNKRATGRAKDLGDAEELERQGR